MTEPPKSRKLTIILRSKAPKPGDELLRRMLQTKPKRSEMIKERKTKRPTLSKR